MYARGRRVDLMIWIHSHRLFAIDAVFSGFHTAFVATVLYLLPYLFPFFAPRKRTVANRAYFGGKILLLVHDGQVRNSHTNELSLPQIIQHQNACAIGFVTHDIKQKQGMIPSVFTPDLFHFHQGRAIRQNISIIPNLQ